MNPIPFCDLSRVHAPLRKELDQAIASCLDTSTFLRGPQTRAFEEEWAAYCGQGYAVCCNSGTDALTLGATALNLKVATIPANTLPLTAIGLNRAGTEVSLSEISEQGWLKLPKDDAVPVLLYGRIPNSSNAPAQLYDAAHAHGWKPPASSAAAWSFYPTKTLGSLGDAGAITTNDGALAEVMRSLCGRDDQLRDRRQITSRMDEIQAAVLRVKLRHLDTWLEQRQEIGLRYDNYLKDLGVTLTGASLHHLYVIRVPRRDDLARFLQERGIGTKIHWGTSLDELAGSWRSEGSYEQSKAWCASVLSLPCFPGLRLEEVDRICDAIKEWYD